MNTDVLALYTQNIGQGQKNYSRINAVYSGCLVVRVGGSRLGVGLIKCCDFQRSLLACSISNLSVLATRGAYVFIFSLCCMLSVCNVFTTPRAAHQSRPLPLVMLIFKISPLSDMNAPMQLYAIISNEYKLLLLAP